MKLRSNSCRYLLVVVATLVAFVLVELICRVFVPPHAALRFQQNISDLKDAQHSAATAIVENDPELFWRLAPNKRLSSESWPFFGIISNRQSLREDHEIPLKKPAGELRILFLGDSCTFGYGVAHKETFVEVVESSLRNQTATPSVECINAGVPSYTLFQGYRRLVTDALRYQPDLVVLNFGWNDYRRWDDLGDAEHYALRQAMQPPRPLNHSHLCRLIWTRIAKQPETHHREAMRPRMLPEEFVGTLEELYALTRTQRIPLLVLVWPMRENSGDTPSGLRSLLQLEMIAFGQAHPMSTSPRVSGVLDLVPLGQELVREHGSPAVYFDQGHMTDIGHQSIGSAIVEHLTPWLKDRQHRLGADY